MGIPENKPVAAFTLSAVGLAVQVVAGFMCT